jgi:hypothetical protein
MPSWPLALVPLVGFALQEQLERLASGAPLEPLAPTFLVGLALQLPFALAAVVLARRLARTAESFGRAAAASPPRGKPRAARPRPPRGSPALRPSLALAHPKRGPPPP